MLDINQRTYSFYHAESILAIFVKMYNVKFSPTSPSGFTHFNGMKTSFYLDERENNFLSLYIINICLLYSCTCNSKRNLKRMGHGMAEQR